MKQVHILVEAGLYNDDSLHLQIIFGYIVSSEPQINLWNRMGRGSSFFCRWENQYIGR